MRRRTISGPANANNNSTRTRSEFSLGLHKAETQTWEPKREQPKQLRKTWFAVIRWIRTRQRHSGGRAPTSARHIISAPTSARCNSTKIQNKSSSSPHQAEL